MDSENSNNVSEAAPQHAPQVGYAFIVTFIALLLFFIRESGFVDDAYISMRFANNVANGFGFAWNPGDLPVEGFSTFGYVLLLTCLHWVFSVEAVPGVVFYLNLILVSIPFTHAYQLMLRRSGDSLVINTIAFVALCLGLLFSGQVVAAFSNGMETALFGVAIYFMVYFRSSLTEKPAHGFLFYVMALAVTMIRFEGFLCVLALIIVAFVIDCIEKPYPRRAIFQHFVLPLVLIGAVFFVRYSIFGSFVPLSVTAKSNGLQQPVLDTLLSLFNREGIFYLLAFSQTGIVVVVTLILGALTRSRQIRVLSIYALAVAAALAVVALQNGGDWMRGFRLMQPISLTALAVFALLIVEVSRQQSIKRKMDGYVGVGVLAIGLLFAMQLFGKEVKNPHYNFSQGVPIRSQMLDEVIGGLPFRHVAMAAGLYPYYAERVLVEDFNGLVTPCIGLSPSKASIWGKWNFDCVFHPDHLMFEVNQDFHGRTLVQQGQARGIELMVVLGWRGQFVSTLNGRSIVFIRQDAITRVNSSGLLLVSYEDYLKGEDHLLGIVASYLEKGHLEEGHIESGGD